MARAGARHKLRVTREIVSSPQEPTPRPTPSHPLLDALWARYVVDVPYAAAFARMSRTFQNDHIALRSLGPGGIDMFARVFASLGWRKAGEYAFPDVHLRAIHMSQEGLPRIFISELDVAAMPDAARAILERLRDVSPMQPTPESFVAPSRLPTSAELDVVAQASQYGAWVLTFGRKVNHFTASVDDVEEWQRRLVEAGVPMKSDIEGERGGPLRQTATHAAPMDITLADVVTRVLPYAYVEIAQRRAPFDGFLAPQARQLFDMTAR